MSAPITARPTTITMKQWVGFAFMSLGMFMSILDIQIVSSSLNEIQAGLSASQQEISWVQTSYLIAEVIVIPITGFLSEVMSTRILFCVATLGFTIFSVLCASAWNIQSMIVFRALQGFFGGAMIPTVFAANQLMIPTKYHDVSSIIMGLCATVAPTLGPTLGGYLTQTFSWHWLFLINLVPGLAITTVVWKLIHIDHPNLKLLKTFDAVGLLLLAIALGCLQYCLEEGPQHEWFDDALIRGVGLVSVSAGVLFLAHAVTHARPILDLSTLKDRNFFLCCALSFVIGTGLYGSVYILPLFLARVRDFNSLDIGLVMAVTGAFQILTAPFAIILCKKCDLRLVLFFGLLLFGVGLNLNRFLTIDSAFWNLFIPQALRGGAMMLCIVPITRIALGNMPYEKIKNASSLYNTMRNLGGAIMIATLNTLLQTRGSYHYSQLADKITDRRHEVTDFLSFITEYLNQKIGLDSHLASLKLAFQTVHQQVAVLSFNDCFFVMGAVFFGSLLLWFLLKKPEHTEMDIELE